MKKTIKMMTLLGAVLLVTACGNAEVKETAKMEEAKVAEVVVEEVVVEEKVEDRALEDTYWKLAVLNEQEVALSKTPYILLNKINGVVNGYTGANSLSSSYELVDMELTFGPSMITRRYIEEAAETEANFVKALEATKTYDIDGQTLYLIDGEGAIIAEFYTEK